MPKPKSLYTERHAKSGIQAKLPSLECWPNQYPGYEPRAGARDFSVLATGAAKSEYEVTIEIPEFTAVCPRTGLPDFGTIRIRYVPKKWCVELKALRYYINGYRPVGIFQENAVNRILNDFVAVVKPVWAVVTGEFNIRGGMKTTVEARYPKKERRAFSG